MKNTVTMIARTLGYLTGTFSSYFLFGVGMFYGYAWFSKAFGWPPMTYLEMVAVYALLDRIIHSIRLILKGAHKNEIFDN